MSTITDALRIAAQGLPVFPVAGSSKRPALSNPRAAQVLGREIRRGQGGCKLASTNSDEVRAMFEAAGDHCHIAVAMGEASGLVAVDIDLYKSDDVKAWMEKNKDTLAGARMHTTQSGGVHLLYKYPSGTKLPAKLSEGVDIKGEGGYVIWPPSLGYTAQNAVAFTPFPKSILNGTVHPDRGLGDNWHTSGSDEFLVNNILSAEDFHASLRALAARMVVDGKPHAATTLRAVMEQSVAAADSHPRHEDWQERFESIDRLVDSARYKFCPEQDVEFLALITEHCPVVSAPNEVEPPAPRAVDEVETVSIAQLYLEPLELIQWLLEPLIPVGGIVSIAGTSNVGKTRLLALIALVMTAGRTDLLGFAQRINPVNLLWLANEERRSDIKRRLRAAALMHGLTEGKGTISLRGGRDHGPLRLVVLGESGHPEVSAENIDWLVAQLNNTGVQVLMADPYVTLATGADENSSETAECINTAFLEVSARTNCSIIHVHHTPKDRSKATDWYRGDSGAWRGSGAIYSALDSGATLSPWLPMLNAKTKATWNLLMRAHAQELGRWIVMDLAKLREGVGFDPLVYRMLPQAMPEGGEIGVVRLASEDEAISYYEAMAMGALAQSIKDQP